MTIEYDLTSQLVTVRGVVVPAGWSDNGDVTAVAISAIGEEEYLVDDREKRDELCELIQEEIEVTGVVIAREDGNKGILVLRYHLPRAEAE